jgi:serine/threonine protein phosphatase PrpC
MKSGTLEAGDIFLLCTDGLTAHVEDSEILALASQHRPQEACDLLVALTLDRGAVDNVTVLTVQFNPTTSPAIPTASIGEDFWE